MYNFKPIEREKGIQMCLWLFPRNKKGARKKKRKRREK